MAFPNETDLLLNKLSDIRDMFTEDDQKEEGHGMEDAISSPYAVATYAENKMKRLLRDNKMVKEAYKDREDDIAALLDVLREIDTHIRCTSDPVPYIINVLKSNLPEYAEYE